MNTFSAGILKKIKEDGRVELDFLKQDEEILLGNKFHTLICYYLKNFNIEKMEKALNEEEFEIFLKFKNSPVVSMAKASEKLFIEQPFFIKETLDEINERYFYLTGRFDAVGYNNGRYTIYDWKKDFLPKNPKDDIQTLVYMYSLSKLFNTENIEMIYYSIQKEEMETVLYEGFYLDRIKEIIKKIF